MQKTTDLRDGVQFVNGSADRIGDEATAVRSEHLRVRLNDVADILAVCLFHQSTELSIRDLQ